MMPPVSANTALFLDIDGTLLDLARTPDRVKVPSDLLRALERLTQRLSGALALVSGRSLESIDKIFAPFRPAAVGAHGGEIRGVDGAVARSQPLPEKVVEIFTGLAQNIPGLLLEDKRCALALHYRLAPHAETAIFEAVSLIKADLPNAPMEVLPGKCVCEIKHPGFTKASGVRELMTREPFEGRRPLFIGDDVTDESVFAIMPDFDGLAFSVGRRAQGVAGHFDSPGDVRKFLASLLDDERAMTRP